MKVPIWDYEVAKKTVLFIKNSHVSYLFCGCTLKYIHVYINNNDNNVIYYKMMINNVKVQICHHLEFLQSELLHT